MTDMNVLMFSFNWEKSPQMEFGLKAAVPVPFPGHRPPFFRQDFTGLATAADAAFGCGAVLFSTRLSFCALCCTWTGIKFLQIEATPGGGTEVS